MIDGHEHRDLSLPRDGRGQVGAPHRVHRVGDDGAVVVARASGRADPRGGEEIVLAHEPQSGDRGARTSPKPPQAYPSIGPQTLMREPWGWRSWEPRSDRLGCYLVIVVIGV